VSYSIPQRRHERHPIGLAVVVGLHVLLAAMMLTATLRIPSLPTLELALTKINPPPPPAQMQWHDLPSAPASPVRQIVVPVPEVIVDRPDAIQAAWHEAPVAPVTTPSVGATATASHSDGAGASAGNGDGAGARIARIEPRLARVDPYAAQCQPEYPMAARLHHVAGTTRLRFTVDVTGHIIGVKLLRHSGDMAENFQMDRAAMDWLVRCPAMAGIDESGNLVGGTADIDYIWHLE
jgi:outer membrane biosynthesis protein TonB